MTSFTQGLSTGHPRDFQLTLAARRGLTYHRSDVLLAKACFDGTLELLTAAWQRLLGYGHQEFSEKTLRQIMEPGKPVAAVVAAIFDERNPAPVELKVRGNDGQCKCLKLHRRFDPYERTVFIVAEETLEQDSAPPAHMGGDGVTENA
jgi:hypothetical protein